MKKLFQLIFILIVATTSLHAQQQGRNVARIHAAKMAYLQDRLHISGDRYRGFAAIYEQYENEIRDTRHAFFGKYKNANPSGSDDATSRQLIDDNLDYQQAIIEIKRKYKDRFLRVLSPQQLATMYLAEREFKQMLVQRLRGRRASRMNR